MINKWRCKSCEGAGSIPYYSANKCGQCGGKGKVSAHSPKWQERFLNLAETVAGWSHDPSTKVGAVIVDENKIVRGMGYNSFPRGIKDLEERYNDRELKYELIVHAEVNAILNSNSPVKGCIIYVWPTLMVPNVCPNCAKTLVQAGISAVVARKADNLNPRWQKYESISKILLEEAGIDYYLV